MQATVLVGLAAYVLARDHCITGTPQQTWPGWCVQAPCSPSSQLTILHAGLAATCHLMYLHIHLFEALCCASRSVRCFHGWWSYLKLALPSVGACCLEWWLYEGLILMAGWFPNADVAVAAMGVGFNTTALTYTISLGVGGMPAHAARSSCQEGFAAASAPAALIIQGPDADGQGSPQGSCNLHVWWSFSQLWSCYAGVAGSGAATGWALDAQAGAAECCTHQRAGGYPDGECDCTVQVPRALGLGTSWAVGSPGGRSWLLRL